jgi:hypothetical protein
MTFTPRVAAARRKACQHPLVRATIDAEQEIRRRYPRKTDWPLAVQEQVALIGLRHGHIFADRVGYGLRSRLKLLDERCCDQKHAGCQCHEQPCHLGPHTCACGKTWARTVGLGRPPVAEAQPACG